MTNVTVTVLDEDASREDLEEAIAHVMGEIRKTQPSPRLDSLHEFLNRLLDMHEAAS
jgi:hypothetical protein